MPSCTPALMTSIILFRADMSSTFSTIQKLFSSVDWSVWSVFRIVRILSMLSILSILTMLPRDNMDDCSPSLREGRSRAPPRAPVTSPGPRKTPVCPPPGPNHAQKAPPAPMDSPLEPGLAPMPGASLPMSLRQAPAHRSRWTPKQPGTSPNSQKRAIPKLHGRKCTESTIFQACFVPRAGKPTIPPVQCPPAGHPVTAAGLLDTACRSALDRSRAPVRYPVPTCTCTVVRHEKFPTTARRPHLSCADAPPGGQNRPRT